MTRNVLAALVGLVLFGVSALAGDHHREHPIPGIEQGCLVYVRPGQQVQVSVTFEASWENCVQIYEHRSGRLLQVWNNYDGGGGTWTSAKNTTDAVQILLLVSRHKTSPPDGRKPWISSPFRLLDQSDDAVTIGWEDGADADYNDAVAVVRVLR